MRNFFLQRTIYSKSSFHLLLRLFSDSLEMLSFELEPTDKKFREVSQYSRNLVRHLDKLEKISTSENHDERPGFYKTLSNGSARFCLLVETSFVTNSFFLLPLIYRVEILSLLKKIRDNEVNFEDFKMKDTHPRKIIKRLS